MLDAGELPTAIFAGNDRCAVGVLDMLRRAGVDVPFEVSVAGFDDSQLSRLAHIDLTTRSPGHRPDRRSSPSGPPPSGWTVGGRRPGTSCSTRNSSCAEPPAQPLRRASTGFGAAAM